MGFAVEVCGFGVPLPGSNSYAAWESKNGCYVSNVLSLQTLHHRFLK